MLTPERIDVIVEGLRLGLDRERAVRRSGVTDRSFFNWIQRARHGEKGLYAELLRRVEEVVAPVIPPVSDVQDSVQREFVGKSRTKEVYTERLLTLAIVARVSQVLEALGLPEAKSVREGESFKNGFRPDILIAHVDGTYSICEVKTNRGRPQSRHWSIHNGVGQLLYYFEVFTDEERVDPNHVRLVLLSDFEPDVYLVRAMSKTTPPILHLNVFPLVMGESQPPG